MTDYSDLPRPSIEESNLLVQPNWESMGLQLLAEIATKQDNPIRAICYPGCGNDATPSSAIPNAVVTYIDPDPANTKDLEVRSQDHFHLEKLEDFIRSYPDAHFDMVYLMNSYAPDRESVGIARNGGKIVVNNWLGHATNFYSPAWKEAGLTLVGALVREKGSIRYEAAHPEDSLLAVQSEAELKRFVEQIESNLLQFYENTQLSAVPNVIRSIFARIGFLLQKEEDIVVAYQRFYAQQFILQQELLKKLGAPEDLDMPLMIQSSNGQSVELPKLPPKMANVFLWVFEKNVSTSV